MLALRCTKYEGVEALTVETVPDPQAGPGEVLIEVRCGGLNYPDALIVAGKYQVRPELPFTPGAEAAGVVVAVGEGVERFAVGQRVITFGLTGAFATLRSVPQAQVAPLPDGMSFEVGAGFVTAYGTSYHALKQRAQIVPGETLLVLGAAGGVGRAAVELGAALGAQVIAAASNADKLAVARTAGAAHTIDYSSEDLKARVRDLTDGRGADVVFDPVGGAMSEAAVRATAWDGRFLVIGFACGEIPRIPLNLPLLKGLYIVGVFWGEWASRYPQESATNLAELFSLFGAGRIAPLVSAVVPLGEFKDAFALITERRALGKVVLQMPER